MPSARAVLPGPGSSAASGRRPRRAFTRSTWAQALGLLAAAGLVAPPLVVLLIGAFSSAAPGMGIHWSLVNAARAFDNPHILSSLLNSVLYAGVTATAVLAAGGALAFVIERTDSRFSRLAEVFSIVPVLMPAVTLASAWIMLLSPRGGVLNAVFHAVTGSTEMPFNIFTFKGMVWVSILQELPLAFLWLQPVLRAMNPELEEAARVSGARLLRILFKVTLPVIFPALLGAWLMFFVYSFGALSVPILIGLPGHIFLYSTEIYLATTRIPTNYGAASFYSLLLLALTVVTIVIYNRLARHADRYATIRGKAFNPRRYALGRKRVIVDGLVLAVLLISTGLPILVLVWNAFMPYPQVPSWASLHTATLSNFADAVNYGPAMHAIWNSFWIGTLAGLITTAIGAAIAWLRMRTADTFHLTMLTAQIATLPIAMPGMIVGVSLIWLFLTVPAGIYASPWILLLAYVILHLPYAVRMCTSGLLQLHAELEEAGRVSGGTAIVVFRRIVLALLGPVLISTALYVSLRSFREYAASLFLVSPGTEVFSVVVLDMWQGGNVNTLAAYTVMVMAMLVVVLTLAAWANRRLGVRQTRS